MSTQAIVPILYTVENGSPDAGYGLITLLHDGDGGRLQVTLGVGYTEGGGDLKAVLTRYTSDPAANAQLAQGLRLFVPRINDFDGPNKTILASNTDFLGFLKKAGSDQAMQRAQDAQFALEVTGPAYTWAQGQKLTLPLSFLVIADSYLQSGEIFQFLRNRFPATTPLNGGSEKDWISEYLATRNAWLVSAGGAMKSSAYRTAFYQTLIDRDDWDLGGHAYVINGSRVDIA
jgi:chitosanase